MERKWKMIPNKHMLKPRHELIWKTVSIKRFGAALHRNEFDVAWNEDLRYLRGVEISYSHIQRKKKQNKLNSHIGQWNMPWFYNLQCEFQSLFLLMWSLSRQLKSKLYMNEVCFEFASLTPTRLHSEGGKVAWKTLTCLSGDLGCP